MIAGRVDSVISRIEAWVVQVPLLHEWATSPDYGEHACGDPRLILRLQDEDGFEGWGEYGHLPADASIASAAEMVRGKRVGELRLGFLDLHQPGSVYWQRPLPPSPFTPPVHQIRHRLRHPLQMLFETALADILGRRTGLPLAELWGGRWRDGIAADYWAGRITPEHAQRCVKRAQELGFHGIKIKTTLEDPNVERLEAIKAAGGPDFHVTVDPNGRFYRFDDAWPTIRAMDGVGNMAVLEDPFPRFHLEQFARLRERINARLVLHIDPPESLWNVIRSDAVGGLNLDSHSIGLTQWRGAAELAAQANLAIWHGSGLDLGISTAVQLHLAASAPNCTLPGDQIGPWLREAHLLKQNFTLENGTIKVPTGPGLGIEVDLNALEKYAVRKVM